MSKTINKIMNNTCKYRAKTWVGGSENDPSRSEIADKSESSEYWKLKVKSINEATDYQQFSPG